MKKKTISALATIVTAAVILIGGVINEQGDKNPLNNSSHASSSVKSNRDAGGSQESTYQASITFPEEFLKADTEGIAPFSYIEAIVSKVTDGDTFHINYENRAYKVRMLDIDTPESVKAGVKPQPFSKEASRLTEETLTGRNVKLIFEKDTTDQFDRLLAHVILEDNTYYNAYMVENGYAICVFYSPNTLLKEYFNELQDNAVNEQKGFWKLPEKERPFIKDSKGKYIAAYKSKEKAA